MFRCYFVISRGGGIHTGCLVQAVDVADSAGFARSLGRKVGAIATLVGLNDKVVRVLPSPDHRASITMCVELELPVHLREEGESGSGEKDGFGTTREHVISFPCFWGGEGGGSGVRAGKQPGTGVSFRKLGHRRPTESRSDLAIAGDRTEEAVERADEDGAVGVDCDRAVDGGVLVGRDGPGQLPILVQLVDVEVI